MGAFSLSTIIEIVCGLVSELYGEDGPRIVDVVRPDSTGTSENMITGSEELTGSDTGKRTNFVRKMLTGTCMAATFLLCSSRTASNYVNYSGKWEVSRDDNPSCTPVIH